MPAAYGGRVPGDVVTVFLAGDVMTGRGVDQILPHPGDPRLWETYMRDARGYVDLAESVNGPVPRPVEPTWPWGDALACIDAAAPDVRLVNLETAVTDSEDVVRGKSVNYRMHPRNIDCLTAARLDVCSLANNHVLDFGPRGLVDTLDAMAAAGITTVGAGRELREAPAPAVLTLAPGTGRLVVVACGTESSGIPSGWAAGRRRPGVNLLPGAPQAAAKQVLEQIAPVRRPGDLVVVSVHWGGNWGYDVHPHDMELAHRLVDGGVDVVHGHSSHHPRPIEIYHDRLVLYGCGDLINDYEGIGGHDEYRDDLRLLYFASLERGNGRLTALRTVPLQAHRMRLRHASTADARWLRERLGLADVIRPGRPRDQDV
jgi:poly-gamma-glutamate capsule biosynthesis protein CapA/YwtB (metallophosphatase superfamily)